jgi:hypothetical protein
MIGPWTRGEAGSGRSGTVFEFPICHAARDATRYRAAMNFLPPATYLLPYLATMLAVVAPAQALPPAKPPATDPVASSGLLVARPDPYFQPTGVESSRAGS